ncbi:P44/Msp2 family outer membrane protein [Wolbachia endosymbiont of Pentalonia nigronervosa]|jgi:opacity protein-like surface antigen|uniref:P44/Msp2 family outer membrane protein n=1 Tax=Wolbachia endosymbiont of Pentalonia nigronervosa TaxID=1301914 RepID=UPI00165FEDC9|nr:P44/Msp2 family outer membrane protein [Wolbachia endosymbiont of Pentalonia nigronervosa]MBD0391795.1 P44/Msp2 family outer membrane protein [Wolbachia endosymbiont of Pentalonia nigronervosa]
MNYKKIFSATALVTLLSLSHSAFSDPVGDVEDGDSSYYIRAQYHGDFFNVMSDKELKWMDGTTAKSLLGFKKDGTGAEAPYKPKYTPSLLAGGIAAGYTMEGIRAEFEVFYSGLGVDGSEYKQGGDAKPDNAKAFGKADSTLVGDVVANAKGTNDGFKSIVAMVNAYYDVDLGMENIPVTPYVGAGVGASRTTFAGNSNFKLAYQAKAGISYAVTPEIKVYGGYRYFGMYGAEFKDSVLQYKKGGSGADKDTLEDVKITLQQEGLYGTLGVHGIEAGVMFHF